MHHGQQASQLTVPGARNTLCSAEGAPFPHPVSTRAVKCLQSRTQGELTALPC